MSQPSEVLDRLPPQDFREGFPEGFQRPTELLSEGRFPNPAHPGNGASLLPGQHHDPQPLPARLGGDKRRNFSSAHIRVATFRKRGRLTTAFDLLLRIVILSRHTGVLFLRHASNLLEHRGLRNTRRGPSAPRPSNPPPDKPLEVDQEFPA